MKTTDSLKEYVSIRNSLLKERQQVQERLAALNEALGALPTPSMSAIDGAISSPAETRRGRRGGGKKTRRRQMSPEGRARIAAAARERWAKSRSEGRARL